MDDLDNRKVILIPAVPSGGTSALAGVLHHLGVDMGEFSLEAAEKKRGYEMYEDTNIRYFCSRFEDQYIPMAPRLLATRMRFRHYLNHRLIGTEGPQGVKISASLCQQDEKLATLPIVTLDITRPLEDSIIADLKRAVQKDGYRDKSEKGIRIVHNVRAADIAACWWAKKELLSVIEPELTITFNELVRYPRKSVENIIVALQNADLGCEFLPTRKQRDKAVLFLDKDKKSI